MYETYYHLTERPFQLRPDGRMFYDSSTHRRALAYLTYGLNHGEGIVVVTGAVGTGKTTVLDVLIRQHLSPDLVLAKLSTTQLGATDLLQMVVTAFALQPNQHGKAGYLIELERFLREVDRSSRRSVLIVDEVQNLPFESLEELRMLLNLEADGKPLLQLVLLGQPQFRDLLGRPELEQLRQRVVAFHHIEPLGRDETRAYIEHRLRHSGWQNDPKIADAVFDLAYEETGGNPRSLNTLFDRLMLYGSLEEVHDFTGPFMNAALKEIAVSRTAGAETRPALVGPAPEPAPAHPAAAARASRFDERLLERRLSDCSAAAQRLGASEAVLGKVIAGLKRR